MSSFTNALRVEIPTSKNCLAILLTEFDYHFGSEDSNFIIHVPSGFKTDLASTPFFAWSLGFPKWGQYSKAAVVHDYLYQSKLVDRATADAIFREAMGVLGVPRWKANVMYSAVRLFGWLGYAKNNLPK